MNTAPSMLSDNDALKVYRAIQAEQDEGRRSALVSMLGAYRDAKRAQGVEPFQPSPEEQAKRTSKFELLYAGLDGVENNLAPEQRTQLAGLLETAPNPAEVKARMVNMGYLADNYGSSLPAGWNEANWPAVKRTFAKQALGIDKPDVSDTELFGAIGAKVGKQKAERAMLSKMVEGVTMAAFDGSVDYLEAYAKVAPSLEADAGYDAASRDRYRAVAKKAFEAMKARVDTVRPMAENILTSLARLQGTRPEFDGAMGYSMDELVRMVKDLPDEDRSLLYSVVAQKAQTSPDANPDKSLGQQSGEALGRGFMDVLRANKAALNDNPNAINLRALAGAADRVTVAGERKPGESLADWVNRSQPGNYGIVDFVGDVARQKGQPFLRNRRKLTEEEQATLKEEVADMMKDRTVRKELRDIAEGTVDPIKGANFVTDRILYPFLQTAAYSAQAFVPYAGLPLLFTSTMGMRADEMMARGASIEDAQKMAMASAVVEAPVEYLQAKMVAGGFPIFKKLLEAPVAGLGQLTGRAAAILGVELVEQNLQEALQDVTPLVVQHVASKLTETVPGIDWQKELAIYGKERVDTFWALLPMALIGTGSATFSDAAYGRAYLNSKKVLLAAGFTEDVAARIIEAPTIEEKQAIIRDSWNDLQLRDLNTAAARAAAADMDEDMRATYADVNAEGSARVIRLENGEFAVEDADGNLVDMAGDVDAALDLVRDYNAAQNANQTQAIQDMIDYVERFQEAGQSIELVDQSRSLQDLADAGEMTQEEADAIVDTYVALGRLEQGATASDAVITGENQVTRYDARRRVVEDVSRIYDGASPLTVVEEHVEGYLKRRLAAGDVTLEDVVAWRDSLGIQGGTDERSLIEFFSEQAQAYLVGKSQARDIPSSFRVFLQRLRAYFQRILELSARLMKAEADGTLPTDFKTHLARSVGLDEAYIQGMYREQERAALGEDGQELASWIKGRLPHPADARAAGEPLAGELEDLFNGMGSRQKAQAFFAKKGSTSGAYLDGLVEAAREDGFNFETPGDLLAALDNSLRGIPTFPDYSHADSRMAGPGGSFSLGRATPADASNVVEMADGSRLVGPTTFSITAYHGTPHKVDKFSMANIGTGEGAQAYGWGLYFAQSKEVALAYQKALSKKNQRTATIPSAFGDVEVNEQDPERPGSVYTVELLPDADEFLDWDAPLSAQSEKVKAALAKYIKELAGKVTSIKEGRGYGSDAYQLRSIYFGGTEKDTTDFFRSLGIPGIRYLDGGSRGVGEGTRNFVLFDDSLVKIVAENGRPVDGTATFSLAQTNTPEFKAWFGDSKVVDAQGKPLVVYHGTAADFSVFDSARGGQNFGQPEPGFFFSNFPGDAEAYAAHAAGITKQGASIMPVFVALENPLVFEEDSDGRGALSLIEWRKGLKDYVADAMSRTDYDGVIARATDILTKSGDPETIVIAKRSTQIKSAIGNRGTFDPSSPDITMGIESRKRVGEIQDGMRMRRVAERVASAEHAGEAFGPAVRKAMEGLMYEVVPNKTTVAEALKVVDTHGVEEALNIVLSNTADYPPNVQVALGLGLMEHFNAVKNYEKATLVGERVAELGTELGRGVQVFSLLGRVLDTPEKAQVFLARQVKKAEKAIREKQPAIDAAKDTLVDIQAEALKLLEVWLDQINGVAGRKSSLKPARVEDLPDLTFSINPRERAAEEEAQRKEAEKVRVSKVMEMRRSGIVSTVARMLKESGAVETRKALTERYGDKVVPFLPDIMIEAQKLILQRASAGTKKAQKREKKAGERKAKKEAEEAAQRPAEPAATPEQIDATLDEIRDEARRADIPMDLTAIDEHFRGKRLTAAEVDLVLADARAFGLGKQGQTQLEGLEDIAQRFEEELISRMKVRGFETPGAVRDAVRRLFETKGVSWTAQDIERVFAEKFKVPAATEAQRARLAELAENIRSTPDRSAERTDATVELMNHVNDILKPVDVVDKAWAVWYANVLSGYNTHFRNLYANFMEQTLALPLDATRVNPIQTLQLLREMLYGVKAGASIGAAEAKRQVQTGDASILQTEANKFGTAGTLERVDFAGGAANPFNWLRYVGRALRAEDLFAYSTAVEAKARMVAWEMATQKGLMGEARDVEIARLLNATEEQVGDFKERAAREWENLTDELKAKTTPDAWQARRVKELRILERDAALTERASEFAARATFNYKPDGFVGIIANSLTDFLGRVSAIEAKGKQEMLLKALATTPKLVVPFVRIVANVLNRGIDYAGLGAVRAVSSSKLTGSVGRGVEFQAKTADERAMELKRGIFGIVALGILSALGDPDDEDAPIRIHGSGSGSRDKNLALHGPRWMPYSIEVRTAEGSKFVTYQYSPLLIGLAIIGAWHDAKRYRKLDEKEQAARLAVAITGAGSVLLEQSFLSNAADVLNMFSRDGQVSERAVYSFLGRTFNPAAVAVPFSNLVANIARDFDPVQRDRTSIQAALLSFVPVASYLNEPALDVLGDAIPNRPLDWFARAEQEGTPEARIYRAFAAKDAPPTSVWSYKGKMEPEQFYTFTKERGAWMKAQLLANDAELLRTLEGLEPDAAQVFVENLSRSATMFARSRVGYIPDSATR